LGEGLVPGSLLLLGGSPGIGKSTLILQVAASYARLYGKALYVSGEESLSQIKLRGERLGVSGEEIYLLAEMDVERITEAAELLQPKLVIVDSIQTVYSPSVPASPGSVSQVRECTSSFLRLAKERGTSIILIGHVTKEGYLAGPRVLEHLVDVVLYLEGERYHSLRLLRAVKNRFGSTHEVGLFEMTPQGMREVGDPSEMFLSQRPEGAAGSCVVACMEGNRPLLLEIQSLVTPSAFPNPRRLATGVDFNRSLLLMAILEKRAGLNLGRYDIYLNVAGGMEVREPAADLGICLAIASSLKDRPLRPSTVVMGEVGLAGELRAIPHWERRVEEAARLGFRWCICPPSGRSSGERVSLGILTAGTLREALDMAFS